MVDTESTHALTDAAHWAQRAPSILNTQPWRWRVADEVLELFADRSRQLRSIDPEARLLTLSCGAALHHARTVLVATGYDVVVDRFPEPGRADLLARLCLSGRREPHFLDHQALEAIRRRHTDRRPFASIVAIPKPAISSMNRAAEQESAWLYQIPPAQVPTLLAAAELAAAAEDRMDSYQAELEHWTHRPRQSGEGVPAETITAPYNRPVPIRDFARGHETLLDPGFGDDRYAEFFILATAADTSRDWLRAGEATSAVWLTATSAGLVASVMSDVTEIRDARALLSRLLHPTGYPQLVLRVGVDMQPALPATSPRRQPDIAGPPDA